MLGEIEGGARIPSYTQICRGQKALKVLLGINGYDGKLAMNLIIGSRGVKASNRGIVNDAEEGCLKGVGKAVHNL
ncbi:MAG: hypothetical protein JRM98_05515 [Nitrososphaerota archaeon]|jgi:hypothetical protein|nr:hypothetical protein [Nitrososphaerota archaeon]MDG7043556.1 hypothetical protein [Nitrososphaerota archaeon]